MGMIADPDNLGDAGELEKAGNPGDSGDQWNLRNGGGLGNHGTLPPSVDPRLKHLTGGSRKGKPNKIGSRVARDILAAYMKRGGVAWLAGLSDQNFIAVFKGVIPKEVSISSESITSQSVAEQLLAMRGDLK